MTDLLHTIPEFPTKNYTHLLPSLEKNLITTTDLLTLDALEVAKRAQLPLLDVRRLKEHVLATLQAQLGLKNDVCSKFEDVSEEPPGFATLRKHGAEVAKPRAKISTLDATIDKALGGGIQTGYITEITGESGAGKTQFLLTLLLSAQLPPSLSDGGLGRPTCYISTEHPLPTIRVDQILASNPSLSQFQAPAGIQGPSMSRILTLQTPDLESQDHILTYQLPIALSRHNVGLIVLDSIAANYRAEQKSSSNPAALATRSAQLIRLGALLRKLAREYDCAIVVANQVGDRFGPYPSQMATTATRPSVAQAGSNSLFSSSPASTPSRGTSTAAPAPSVLSLDHQQRFFTGWGDTPPSFHSSQSQGQNFKTPSLGLVWANQIACRIALLKEEAYDRTGATQQLRREEGVQGGAEWTPKKWSRWMRVVFAPWAAGHEEGNGGVQFEVWSGGVRAVQDGTNTGGNFEQKRS